VVLHQMLLMLHIVAAFMSSRLYFKQQHLQFLMLPLIPF
jgi:hypothetical protein